MKSLISILAIFFGAVGCGKQEGNNGGVPKVQRFEEENRRLKELKNEKLYAQLKALDLLGSYEASYEEEGERHTVKMVLFENGKVQTYRNGEIDRGAEIDQIVGKELYLGGDVYSIETNGDLTGIASIWVCSQGFPNRFEFPKDLQRTYKKLK